MAQTPPTNPSVEKHTAVIFVHGMGPQARHENLGRLLKAFEDYYAENGSGALRNVENRTERSRVGDSDDVAYVAFDHFKIRKSTSPRPAPWGRPNAFRAYEAYWSPVTARGAQAWRVAGWALARLGKPKEIADRSWRESKRLRIARLHKLFADKPPEAGSSEGHRQYVMASLLSAIHRFRGAEGAKFEREPPHRPMDADAFLDFAANKVDNARRPQVRDTIPLWDRTRLPVETLATGLAKHIRLIAAATLYLVAHMVGRIVLTDGHDATSAAGLSFLALALMILALVASRSLSNTFADVFIWNNIQDRDAEFQRRREILANTRALFEHVARDEKCQRIVIVAHSLGTAITLETLSLMGQRNVARAGTDKIVELSKLSHLFTLGSPIDKIFYFFHTLEVGTYREGRLNDDLRGNLSQEPFFKDGGPLLRWLNIWDPVDIVSDPLFTPLGSQIDGGRVLSTDIQNYAVENTSNLDAVASHINYLTNKSVVGSVAAALFHNRTEPPRPHANPGRHQARAYLAARHRMIGWLPAAIIAGAVLIGLGGPGFGMAVAAAPIVVWAIERLAIRFVGCAGRGWNAFQPSLAHAILKVRLLVTRPRGD